MRKLMNLVAAAVCVLGVGAAMAGAQSAPVGGPLNQAPNATGSCELAVLHPAFATPSCTLMSASHQVPRGQWTLTQASVRTGPRTGPMQFVVLRAMRSQAQPPGQPPAGVICCQAPAVSRVFTPPPNQTTTINVDLPMSNGAISIDGEPVELVDYLGLTVLDPQSTLPLVGNQGSLISAFLPGMGQTMEFRSPATFPVPAVPTFNGTVCARGGQAASLGINRQAQVQPCPATPTPQPQPGPAPTPGQQPQPGPQPAPAAGPQPSGALAGVLPKRPAKLSLPPTLRQLRINQRIAVAAVRRLNAINARLQGRPAPRAAKKASPGRITATTGQLRINQRISEAGYRRARAIYDRLGGTGARPAPNVAKTVRLNRAGVGINQLTNIWTLDMLKLIDAHMARR